MNAPLGVFLHALGGFAAGSFYIPYKRVRGWAWESYWLVGGVFSWIVAPWVAAIATTPQVGSVLREAPRESMALSFLFGALWGVGGLMFGLTMRYLGVSLGYALALGFCAIFGTIIPPLFQGQFVGLLQTTSGLVTLSGLGVCLIGIGICGAAGIRKERELSEEMKRTHIREFRFKKGLTIAIIAGVMSACMAFGIAAGKPIAALAVQHGASTLWQNTPVFVVILAGGFATNFIWCAFLNIRNRTYRDYASGGALNYGLCALAGVTWYLQFMFYGMGTTQMGRYDFSSWTVHMAFIIVFSNVWGLVFREWKGTTPRTHQLVAAGIAGLVASTLVIGLGNYLGET